MDIKILHTADLHIGSPFTFLPEEKAVFRRKKQFGVLEEIITQAERHSVDALLICGDLFDRPTVPFELAISVSEILSTTKIPVFISPGNHDYFHLSSPYNLDIWPENVHIFNKSAIERVELSGLDVYGAGFTTPNLFRSMLCNFALDQTLVTGGHKPSVIMLHGELNPTQPLYHPLYTEDIAKCGADYLALGHIHNRSAPQRVGNTVFAFSGCPEGRGFDETDGKGIYLVDFEKGVDITFIPLNGAKYYDISVDLTGSKSPQVTVLNALPANSQNNLFRITLTGEVDPDIVSVAEIQESLAPLVFHSEIIDRTKYPRDIWGLCSEDSLRGAFLSLLKEKMDRQTSEDEKDLIMLAARYGLEALDGGEAENIDNF